jgi:hypothetical protein
MIWLLAAAQLSAPVPLHPLFDPNDVPIGHIDENELYTVGIAVTIKPDGKLQDCNIEATSGNRKLDAYTCGLVMRGGRFQRPVSSNGTPAYGIYRTFNIWWVGDRRPPAQPGKADLHIKVAELPPKIKSPFLLRVAFDVDEAGNVSNCMAEEPKSNAALTRVACDQLLKTWKPIPARNAEGLRVPSVQDATVVFEGV